MNRSALTRGLSLALFALLTFESGCIGPQDAFLAADAPDVSASASSEPSADAASPVSGPALGGSTGRGLAASDQGSLPESELSALELSLLQNALSGSLPHGAFEAAELVPGLGEAGGLGLGRRDVAILLLDAVSAREDLPPELTLAARLASAALRRDADAVAALLMAQLLPVIETGLPPG